MMAMSLNRNRMRCPQCNLGMAFDRRVFLGDFLCEQCGAKVLVSEAYSRVLVAISMVVGFGLTWIANLPKLLMSDLGPLAGFLAAIALGSLLALAVLFVMVRMVPRLISPPLVLRHGYPVTVLNLTAEQEDHDSKK